jgi:hypothetical protein
MKKRSTPMSVAKPLSVAGIVAGLLLTLALPAQAVVVQRTYVGTFSSALTGFAANADGTPNPTNDPGLISRGGKYVVQVSFDTDDISMVDASTRFNQTRDFYSVSLGDAPGGTNTYQLSIPSQGFAAILTQTGQDHFNIGPSYAPTAEIHFFSSCSSGGACDDAFRGFEFESNFIRNNSPTTPHPAGDVIFEQYDPDAALSDATVTHNVVNVLDGNFNGLELNGGHFDVLSESSSAAGGQQNPGVFFEQAVDVVAEAGASPLFFDATHLTVTTDGGTEQVTDTVDPIVAGQLRSAPSAIDDPTRQADNDLGAARTDGEDFLNYEWTVDGATVSGNLDGTRLNRVVVGETTADPSPRHFANDGTRTVNDVNIAVGIVESGLTNTLDTTTFQVAVTEDITGFTDTDTVTVGYSNTLPSIVNASATAQGDDILFELSIDDPDLAVNALIPDFEILDVSLLLDGNPFAGLTDLLMNGSELVDHATLLADFGAGAHELLVLATDRFLDQLGGPVTARIDFTVNPGTVPATVPEPATLVLFAVGLAGTVALLRHRRSCRVRK